MELEASQKQGHGAKMRSVRSVDSTWPESLYVNEVTV